MTILQLICFKVQQGFYVTIMAIYLFLKEYFYLHPFFFLLHGYFLTSRYHSAGIAVAYSAPTRHGCLKVVENNYCASKRGILSLVAFFFFNNYFLLFFIICNLVLVSELCSYLAVSIERLGYFIPGNYGY